MESATDAPYFGYWGKATPADAHGERYHLLPFHCLDVAACGRELFKLPRFSLVPLSDALGWRASHVEELCIAFLAIHDIGKFARSFQNKARDLNPSLVPYDPRLDPGYRHDTLGWVAVDEILEQGSLLGSLSERQATFARDLGRIFTGHHGRPPEETTGGGDPRIISANRCFLQEDSEAAKSFAHDVFAMFLQDLLPEVTKAAATSLKRHSWSLAGAAVLADWLGSNSDSFPYHERPMNLVEYWETVAVQKAKEGVAGAGLGEQPARAWSVPGALFPKIPSFTPLQWYAATVALADGPQLFLLEDMTGAGKTEAALLLCHRLMAAGLAAGFYFGLPTMATANQMYERVGEVYRRLYAAEASPSLVLSHGARELVVGFQHSVLRTIPHRHDRSDEGREPSTEVLCNAWLADSRKKALLADVGVGTVDQALLGVLPVRHQSLRLLGLRSKILVVDEVHAYDEYMSPLLRKLIRAQAQQGGSVVLLSATVQSSVRAELVAAFQQGLTGYPERPLPDDIDEDLRYPLATQASAAAVSTHACDTRPELVRRVAVQTLSDELGVVDRVSRWAGDGKAVCWILNTVADARAAYNLLRQHIDAEHLQLFHSRYAMGDRLRIESEVLRRFGKSSKAEQRKGQVLVATQVVEQSLDLDFDEMVTDLAPVDLLIQRAGRLQRHVRDAEGEHTIGAREQRLAPVLHMRAPVFTEDPSADWYSAVFPRAAYVYDHPGVLWLTLRALLEAGAVVSPGAVGEPGSVRVLVEAVYGPNAHPVPTALRRVSLESEGKGRAASSVAEFNALKLEKGYSIDAGEWDAAAKTPTRFGDETRPLYLAREQDGDLVPLLDSPQFAWAHSSVRIDSHKIDKLSAEWMSRFDAAIGRLRRQTPMLGDADEALVLPLVLENGIWVGWCETKGAVKRVTYDGTVGLGV
jgi:CRISPR-associated endonuclease/helicase Cas3